MPEYLSLGTAVRATPGLAAAARTGRQGPLQDFARRYGVRTSVRFENETNPDRPIRYTGTPGTEYTAADYQRDYGNNYVPPNYEDTTLWNQQTASQYARDAAQGRYSLGDVVKKTPGLYRYISGLSEAQRLTLDPALGYTINDIYSKRAVDYRRGSNLASDIGGQVGVTGSYSLGDSMGSGIGDGIGAYTSAPTAGLDNKTLFIGLAALAAILLFSKAK